MKSSLVICDTNIIINNLINDKITIDLLEKIGIGNVIISSITAMELLRGARNKQELALMQKNIRSILIVHFNDDISTLALDFVTQFHLSHQLQIPDSIIAATAVYYQLPLFTYNVKDFKFIPEIKLYPH